MYANLGKIENALRATAKAAAKERKELPSRSSKRYYEGEFDALLDSENQYERAADEV